MKSKNYLILIALFLYSSTWGQGENLFKAKCNTCHQIEKNSTGPMLKGVKAKWEDAGEGALLHDWVKNPGSLIASGKSKMALAIKDFSSTDMPVQEVTDAEIDQIFEYIDTYVPPVANDAPVATAGEGAAVTYVPDYKSNLNIFYALITLMIVLLCAIILMSNSIMTFVRSDLFKTKIKEKNDNSNVSKILMVLVLLGGVLVPNNTFALSTPDMTDPTQLEMPWLKVENVDIYILICINIILLLIVVYLKSLFNNFYYMIYPKKVKAAKAVKKQGKVSKVLVDAVPIEDEASILMDHEYDGIRELDNNLPPWWVWGFYLTILFAIGYILNYHVFKIGLSQEDEYKASMYKAKKEINEYLKNAAMNVDESNVTLMTEQADLDAGKSLFQANCSTCHKDGGGDIGPNLTDNYWLYGNDIKIIFGVIKNGTSNGMPEHASKLNPIQLQQVSSFVLNLKYIPGKEPEGTEYPK